MNWRKYSKTFEKLQLSCAMMSHNYNFITCNFSTGASLDLQRYRKGDVTLYSPVLSSTCAAVFSLNWSKLKWFAFLTFVIYSYFPNIHLNMKFYFPATPHLLLVSKTLLDSWMGLYYLMTMSQFQWLLLSHDRLQWSLKKYIEIINSYFKKQAWNSSYSG